MENKKYYGLRVNRKECRYITNEKYKNAFKYLSELIYGKDTDILFAYGEIFLEDKSDLTYADVADSYTGIERFAEITDSIDIIEIIDENEISVHSAYTWSDILFNLTCWVEGMEYIDESTRLLSRELGKGVSNALTKEIASRFFCSEYDLNQVVFRKDLKGVKIVESIKNINEKNIMDIINRLANKYNLLIKL